MDCPICSSKNTEEFLYINNITTNQNIVYDTYIMAKSAKTDNLYLNVCRSCEFVFNKSFDSSKVIYSENYQNSQIESEYFNQYINEQINWLIEKYINKDDTILEIGCGKGYYIRKMAEILNSQSKKYGFDTSYEGKTIYDDLNLYYVTEYYSDKYKNLNPDFIICRHVIEHIQNPIEFLDSIRKALRPGAILFLETPNLNWILENNIVYDFFYEHCSYFNQNSITKTLNLCGFNLLYYNNHFNGQYTWVVAKVSDTENVSYDNTEIYNFNDICKKYIEKRENIISDTKISLELFKKLNQPTAVWGAGAKGITFVNTFDKNKELIDCIIDINSKKINKYSGNTGHIVVSPEEIIKKNIKNIYVMNENYLEEIKKIIYDMYPYESNKILLFI